MIELPDLMLAHGIQLKQAGNEYTCLCIAHDDHNPSMSVYRNGGGKYVAHCFSCGFHEGIVGVYAELNGLDVNDKKQLAEACKAVESDDFAISGVKHATIKSIAPPLAHRTERTMIIPDASTPPPNMGWLQHKDGTRWGEPDEVFTFRQPDGTQWMHEARWNFKDEETGEIRKECRVFSWGRRGSAPAKWECAHHLPKRPLYGLDMLEQKPDAQIVVCEGARKAESAQKLLPMLVCIGWSGGAQSWEKSDWTVINNKNVILWPDADEPGRVCMKEISQQLIKQGCACWILSTEGMPESWDSVDALKEGWDTKRTLAWAKKNKGEQVVQIEKESEKAETILDNPQMRDLQEEYDINFNADGVVAIKSEAFTDDAGITWAHPADIFDELKAPSVPAGCLPDCIQNWMEDTAGIKGVDQSMLALSAIVASAACLHDAIQIQPERTNPSWKESARLWGAIVGSSGTGKSPAISAAISRIKKIQLDLSAIAIEKWDEVRAKELAYDMANKEYIKLLSKNDPMAQDKKPFRPEPQEITRLLFEDVTVEKLGEELKYSPRGSFLLRDELAGWFGSHSQYRSSGTDAPAWLDFYEGGAKYIDRVGRGSIFVPNFSGCILGGIQPSTLGKIIEKLPEDGLLQRFIVVNAKAATEGNGQPYNKEVCDKYHNMLQQIFDTRPGDMPVMLTPEADAIRQEISAHARKLISTGMISTGFCSHLSKYSGLTARLMLTFHAIECAARGAHPQGQFVQESTAKKVKTFMLDFLLPHSIAFYINLVSQSEIGHAIRKVGELCIIAKGNTISNRDISTGWIGWRHYRPQDQEVTLQSLVDSGWILPHPMARLSQKGQPTKWMINPRLHDVQAARRKEEIERRAIAVEAIEKCREDCRNGFA